MCFETTKSAKAKIAEKDIICWKVIRLDNSPWFTATHNIKTPYKVNGDNEKIKLIKTPNSDYENLCDINEGYHSFKTRHGTENMWAYQQSTRKKNKISRFIIPAGTFYYANRKEYVSETIMLIE